MLFVVINNAIFHREPTPTTEALGRIVVVVGELSGNIVPSQVAIHLIFLANRFPRSTQSLRERSAPWSTSLPLLRCGLEGT